MNRIAFRLVRREGISAGALRVVVVCGVLAMVPLTLLALMLGGRLAAH